MNSRNPSRPGARWRERFVAIALAARQAAPGAAAPRVARIRPRLAGMGARPRFATAAARF